MKKHVVLILCFVAVYTSAQSDINYDESKTPRYVLPDVLRLNNGQKVETKEEWEKLGRPELMEMFASEMYGRTPGEKIRVRYEKLTENPDDMGGKATCKQVKFIFSNAEGKEIEAILLLYIPNKPEKKVPVFVSYNYNGNHSTTTDTTIYYPPSFNFIRDVGHTHRERGNQTSRWCYDRIIDRGYAVATMCYHDIFPDVDGMKEHSIVSLFSGYDAESKAPDEWQAIGAWAWGSSRIVDYLETEERINAGKIAIMGHSRQGKAALWAGVQDTRFGIVISNDSGSGGAALSKREFGERVANVSSIKPYWFCPAFNRYRNNEAGLPFDQHQLIALIAPRKVYIASASEDLWADPKGEFLSAYHAGPVYKLYGMSAIESDRMPELHQPVLTDIGYHIRAGKHDVTDYDWERFMDFMDKHF
ncbi:MAG: acetylxylan esterase [Tannerella sp.]|jgi:hypothetical protein|nr:acetylxylan esterase [Tannerella sp.]